MEKAKEIFDLIDLYVWNPPVNWLIVIAFVIWAWHTKTVGENPPEKLKPTDRQIFWRKVALIFVLILSLCGIYFDIFYREPPGSWEESLGTEMIEQERN